MTFEAPSAAQEPERLQERHLIPVVVAADEQPAPDGVHTDVRHGHDRAGRGELAAVGHRQGTGVRALPHRPVGHDRPRRGPVVRTGLAACAGAKPPLRLPTGLARLLAGKVAVAVMTEGRGFSNAKAKRELGWELRYPSWRQGFTKELA